MSKGHDSRVTKRYSSALFSAAQRLDAVDPVLGDLESLVGIWNSQPQLRSLLESPMVTSSDKKSLITRLFDGKVSPVTLEFLKLLVDKSREALLPYVYHEYQELTDRKNGLVRAHAIVAAQLEADQHAELVRGLEQRTGKRITLNVEVDPGLLGGVVIRLHDTVIDGSVRGSLERMRESMLAGR